MSRPNIANAEPSASLYVLCTPGNLLKELSPCIKEYVQEGA